MPMPSPFRDLIRRLAVGAALVGLLAVMPLQPALADEPVPLPCDPVDCPPVPITLPGCPSCEPGPAPQPGTAPGDPIE